MISSDLFATLTTKRSGTETRSSSGQTSSTGLDGLRATLGIWSLEKLEFVVACVEMGEAEPLLKAVTSDGDSPEASVDAAFAVVLPRLRGVADRVDRHADQLATWNIRMAGGNEVIARDIDRNWAAMRELGMK